MKTIWIAGMGHFGLLALRKLAMQQKERQFVLIDPVKANLEQGKGANVFLEQTDGVDFLEQHLLPGNEPEWIWNSISCPEMSRSGLFLHCLCIWLRSGVCGVWVTDGSAVLFICHLRWIPCCRMPCGELTAIYM